jgi:hypothetical protein
MAICNSFKKLDFCRHPGNEVGQDSIETDPVRVGNEVAWIECEDQSIA